MVHALRWRPFDFAQGRLLRSNRLLRSARAGSSLCPSCPRRPRARYSALSCADNLTQQRPIDRYRSGVFILVCGDHSRSNGVAGLAQSIGGQLLIVHARHFDVNVEAIEQRAGDSFLKTCVSIHPARSCSPLDYRWVNLHIDQPPFVARETVPEQARGLQSLSVALGQSKSMPKKVS
jgi:hypothetical protein